MATAAAAAEGPSPPAMTKDPPDSDSTYDPGAVPPAMRLDLRLGRTIIAGGGWDDVFARFRPLLLVDDETARLLLTLPSSSSSSPPPPDDNADLASRSPDLARTSAFRRRFASTISWYDGYDLPSKANAASPSTTTIMVNQV